MITVKVGSSEIHDVSFNYSTMTGAAKILVDNKEVSSSRVMFVGHTPFTFQVGDKEKHSIRIELDNPLFFAFRGSDVKVIVDEQLTKQDHIGGSIWVIFLPILIILTMLIFVFVIDAMLSLGR